MTREGKSGIRVAPPLLVLLVVLVVVITACAKNKRLAAIHMDRGLAYMEQGQYTPALKELLEAKQNNVYDPVIRYHLGVAYYGKKLHQEAIKELKDAIDIQPNYSEAHNYLGMIYSEMGLWDEAIVEYKRALSNILYETPTNAMNNMGYAYYKKGDYPAALATFDEALAKEPNTILRPLIEKNIGMTYFTRGEMSQAIQYLKKSVDVAPEFSETRYWLARCYLAQKNTKAAADELHLIIKIAPESEFAVKARDLLKTIAEGHP